MRHRFSRKNNLPFVSSKPVVFIEGIDGDDRPGLIEVPQRPGYEGIRVIYEPKPDLFDWAQDTSEADEAAQSTEKPPLRDSVDDTTIRNIGRAIGILPQE